MDPATEIRKLAPSQVRSLVDILEYAESWKKLMCKIPKILENTNYQCKLERNNLPRYHSEHFRMIENASIKLQKSCTEILLDEWGTSGRIRPAVGHLLFLLTEAQLFRAVDYVAKQLLHIEPPNRPEDGPAAPVNLTPTEANPDKEYLERLLNNMTYPSSELDPKRMANLDDINLNLNQNTADNGYYDRKDIDIDFSSNSNNNGTDIEQISEISDLMKFSRSGDLQTDHFQNLPVLTELNLQSDNNITSFVDNNIPQISILLQNDSIQEGRTISDIGSDSFSTSDISSNNTQTDIDGNTPNLSDLMRNYSRSYNINSDISDSNSNFIPIVIDSFVRCNNSNSDGITAESDMKSNDTSKTLGTNLNTNSTSRPCASPLPNLSLNTLLPHFTYGELESTTNSFDETPHKNSLEMANSLDEKNGRFLGSGAFGSVFLSLGLLDRPVAVKKLHLKDMQEVQLTDTITKQFRNEVEILSKYTHCNLLALIGYSCDGPTYCLMYEYLSGGNLQGRLAKSKEKIDWQQRIRISHGIAKAISYLHTAFATPLIHRDIKTANILLDCSNNPKLGDFGIIKLSPNPNNTAISTTIIGTSVYMAPEALRSGDVSVKTDAFSFGVVLLELLTALPPFDADRKERDLISYVEEECEQDGNLTITPLLDIKAGTWMDSGLDFAHKLYKISLKCFDEKKKRPNMVDVTLLIDPLIDALTKEEYV